MHLMMNLTVGKEEALHLSKESTYDIRWEIVSTPLCVLIICRISRWCGPIVFGSTAGKHTTGGYSRTNEATEDSTECQGAGPDCPIHRLTPSQPRVPSSSATQYPGGGNNACLLHSHYAITLKGKNYEGVGVILVRCQLWWYKSAWFLSCNIL